MTHGQSLEVELEGRRLRLTSLDRVLWPEAGFTKGQMIDYYARVAPALLPHVERRAMTLRRFPEGIAGPSWYQTTCPPGHPAWVPVQELPGRGGAVHRFCLVNDVPTLIWAANLSTIELHPYLALRELEQPTVVVFDLDPGPPADILDCCRVALRLRDVLGAVGLASFPKTSGSVGLHVYVPLNTPHTYAETKAFARVLAGRLADEDRDGVTDQQKRSLRAGKVLVDWLQNEPRRSTVAPYSLRATGWPTVSTPVRWDEVAGALATRKPETLTFEPDDALARLDRFGDVFAPVLTLAQTLRG